MKISYEPETLPEKPETAASTRAPWRQYVPRPPEPGDWEHVEDLKVVEFVTEFTNPKSRPNLYRWWRLWQCARNRWFYRNRQWIGVPSNWWDTSQGFQFMELYRRSRLSFPRPVDNRIRPGVDNEIARHTADEYEPIVVGGKDDPGVDAAAKAATEYLKAGLREASWPEIRETLARTMIIEGTGSARSLIDTTILTPQFRVQPDAARCPECGALFSSRTIPRNTLETFDLQHTDTIKGTDHPDLLQLTTCPLCDEPRALSDYVPLVKEAQATPDLFGRPLGVMTPRKAPVLENVSNFDSFPENGGRFVTPATNRIFGQATVRSLDYIAEHYPDIADTVEPHTGWELLRYHPEFSSDHFGVQSFASDSLTHHALVREVTVQPMRDLPKGATFVVIGDQCALKDDLIKDVKWGKETLSVPRVQYAHARMASLESEWWGLTPVDDAVLLNARLNEALAQMQDYRERGYPRVFTRQGVEIIEKDDAQGAFTQVVIISQNQEDIDPSKDVWVSQPITGNAYLEEIKFCVESIQLILGPQPQEVGQAPKNVRTVRGLQILSDQAAKRRGPSQRALENCYNELFTHRLHVVWVLTQEGQLAEEYEQRTATGRRRLLEFKNQKMLGGAAVVEVEKATSTDESVYEAEAAGQWVNLGFIDPRSGAISPTTKRVLAKMMGVPEKLGEEDNVQIDRAEDVWRSFISDGTIPVIDEALDNAHLRFIVLANRWIGDDGVALQRDVDWPSLLRAIAPWEEQLAGMIQRDQALTPYRMLPPQQWGQARARVVQEQQAQGAMQSQQAAAQGLPAPAPAQEPPPAPTPNMADPSGRFGLAPPLPPLAQDRIFIAAKILAQQVLSSMSLEVAAPGKEKPKATKAENALKFWAVIQAYFQLAVKQQQRAMMLPPGSPPPGGAMPGGGGGAPPSGGAAGGAESV